jgi:hypothetical protein
MDGRVKPGHDDQQFFVPKIHLRPPLNSRENSCGKPEATAFSRNSLRPDGGCGVAKTRQM